MRPLLLASLLALCDLSATAAQSIVVRGADGDSASVVLASILERGEYRLLDRDTLLGPAVHLTGDVVVFDARVIVEGRIDGAVAVIDGELFIRPRAAVLGPIAVLGGGAYPSGLAQVGEIIYRDPRVTQSVDGPAELRSITLSRPPPGPPFRLHGFFGFGLPTYDRVDGLSLFWSAGLESRGDTAAVSLRATAAYRTERNRLGGGVSVQVRPASRTLITAELQRRTFTSDAWIRGGLENSLAALFVASDIRDYFESDVLSLTVSRAPPPPLIQGEGYFLPRIGVRASRDRSLETGNPWAFRGDDDWRFNPPIDEGELTSAFVGADAAWLGVAAAFAGDLSLEWSPARPGDFEFAQLRSSLRWDMVSLYQHRITLSGFLLLPLGGREAPLQRWSFVGGPGTLPTFPAAAFRGDHVLFVETLYTIPLVRLRLPLVGEPAIRLIHAAGAAWRTGAERPPLEQNLAAGLELSIFDVMVYVDPTERPLDPTFKLGARIPFGNVSRTF